MECSRIFSISGRFKSIRRLYVYGIGMSIRRLYDLVAGGEEIIRYQWCIEILSDLIMVIVGPCLVPEKDFL